MTPKLEAITKYDGFDYMKILDFHMASTYI